MPEMSLEKIDEIIERSLQLAKDRLNTYIRRSYLLQRKNKYTLGIRWLYQCLLNLWRMCMNKYTFNRNKHEARC